MPSYACFVVAHVIGAGGSPPTLVLFCGVPDMIHWADPNSDSFSSYKDECHGGTNALMRQAQVGGIYAAAREHGTVSSSLLPPEAWKILLRIVSKQFTDDYFSNNTDEEDFLDDDELSKEAKNCCFLVESAGDILLFFKLPYRFDVVKIGDNMAVHPVKSIGRHALLVSNSRCLSVDADKFASVDANSIYYDLDLMPTPCDIRVYSLSDGTDLCSGGTIGSSNDFPPFSVVQLLSWYSYEVRSSELGLEQMIARSVSRPDETI